MILMGAMSFATGAALTDPCILDPHRYRCDEPIAPDAKEAGAVMLASGLALMVAGGVTLLNSNLASNNGAPRSAPKPKPWPIKQSASSQ